MNTNTLRSSAEQGDSRAIGRILTQIEDRTDVGRSLMRDLFAEGGSARFTGVTGTPGAGKSTLTSALVSYSLHDAQRAAIVAVDPSSPFTGGAILGDRIRMSAHAGDRRVFIRSVANRGSLGGISQTTPAIVAALDGLGFGEVIIETVGIGQSEVEIATTADTTVVVVSSGWGDAVQVAKAGFLEIADIFVVNKADREGSDITVRDLKAMLELDLKRAWRPPVVETVATTGKGVSDVWAAILEHRRHLSASGEGSARRRTRAAAQFGAALRQTIDASVEMGEDREGIISEIAARHIDPWTAAERALAAQ